MLGPNDDPTAESAIGKIILENVRLELENLQLSPAQRKVMDVIVMNPEITMQELVDETGLPLNTAKSALFRLRSSMRVFTTEI
jgi:DNA-binding MarR family transcriptional regulator